ncbi:HNH endonuclease [Nonomuraea jabiensis]|uniref:HNH endonuclease n=1 Tax=Nonomuraea jabiensis TaxID=882448 RepID=UPI0036AFD0F3
MHHVRRLVDLTRPRQPQPAWAELMARQRRKTLVVCRTCHDSIHTGQLKPPLTQ